MAPNPTPSDRRRGSRKSSKPSKPSKPTPKPPPTRAAPPPRPSQSDSQEILNVFHHAFHPLFTPRLPALLQQVKSHLFNRDYLAAFSARENLEAYAVRWSPSRALCYTEVFLELAPEVRRVFELREEGPTTEIVCIGGGAGAEVVAAAAAVRSLLRGGDVAATTMKGSGESKSVGDTGDERVDEASGERSEGLDEVRDLQEVGEGTDSAACLETDLQSLTLTPTPPTTTTTITPAATRSLHMTVIDIADWTPITSTLTTALTTSPTPTRPPFLPSTHYTVSFHHGDILTSSPPPIPASTRLITLLFTTNELYTQSRAATTSFLLSLAGLVRSGCILLVLESAGSYSTVQVNGKTFPMGMLLDHTLLAAGGEWESVLKEDARWFRRQEGLTYPVALEDMRFMVRVYRRV